jgi:hypothetical protein
MAYSAPDFLHRKSVIAPVLDDVAEIDPHPKFDAVIGRHIGVSLGHFALYFDGATRGVDDADELDEQAIPRCFDDATAMLLNLGVG